MIDLRGAVTGRFCWVDLAASDARRATTFYTNVFGWSAREEIVNGGAFTRLRLSGQNVGSLYQLERMHIERGVPSHWTPYILVDDADETVRRVARHGGKVLVNPFDMPGIARIALILDSISAVVGLWQPLEAHNEEHRHG
jgi:predicted enzyme related to lactoylglutathione lyase